MDLGGGKVSKKDRAYTDDKLDDSKAHRTMRWIAFGVLGLLCVVFLIALLCALQTLLGGERVIATLLDGREWHGIIVITVALVIFATIPLSLTLALVRMIASPHSQSKPEDATISLPQIEFLKALVETVKTIGGK